MTIIIEVIKDNTILPIKFRDLNYKIQRSKIRNCLKTLSLMNQLKDKNSLHPFAYKRKMLYSQQNQYIPVVTSNLMPIFLN